MVTFGLFGKIKNKKRYNKFVEDVIMHLLPYPYKREIFIAIEFTTDLENAGEYKLDFWLDPSEEV